MKSKIFFNCVIIFKIIVEVKNQKTAPPPFQLPPTNKPETAQSTPALQPTKADNQGNGMSFENIIPSEMDVNAKIEENIVDMIMKFSSNYSSYTAVHFTTSDYVFEKKTVEYDLDDQQEKGKILFENFKVISLYVNDPADPKFPTLVQCNSTGNATIIVDLPEIHISSNVTVTLSSAQTPHHGWASIILKNGTFVGQIKLENNTMKNLVHSAQITNNKSKHNVEIHSNYQHFVHNHLQNISAEVKHSMEKYFTTQVNLKSQLIMNATFSCSEAKLKNPNEQLNSTEIYVIKNRKHDSWINVNFTTGPAAIEGLTNFNQIDLHVWDVSFQNFNNMPCFNELSLRMISNMLKGKFVWRYNHALINIPELAYPFSIDYFEIMCKMQPLFNNDPGFNVVETTIDINLGEIKVFTSELNSSDDEKKFVNAILSDHLEMLINQWLNETLTAKILPKIEHFDCMTGLPPKQTYLMD